MPSVSPKQRRFMAAAAHDADFAKEAGIAQSVAREFFDADQAKKHAQRDRIAKAIVNQRKST